MFAAKAPVPAVTTHAEPTIIPALEFPVTVKPGGFAVEAPVIFTIFEVVNAAVAVTVKAEAKILVVDPSPPFLPALNVPLISTDPPDFIEIKLDDAPIGPARVDPNSTNRFFICGAAPAILIFELLIKLTFPKDFVVLVVKVFPSKTNSRFGSNTFPSERTLEFW